MLIDARLRDWNDLVEHERTLRTWQRLTHGCRAAAKRAVEAVERGGCGG